MSSSQMQEIMEMPREFIKDGTQFINRCTYVLLSPLFLAPLLLLLLLSSSTLQLANTIFKQ